MKNLILLLAALSFSVNSITAQTTEEVAIKKLMQLEAESYRKNDSITWRSLYIHDPKTSHTYATNGYYEEIKGWRKIDSTYTSYIKQRSKPSRYTKIEMSKFDVKYSDQLAWVDYNQTAIAPNDTLPPYSTREVKTLLKENNQWKILSSLSFDTLSYRSSAPDVTENLFNAIGYNFLNDKKISQAIKIFQLNTQMYPKAWNTFDSLGEGYAAAGNKELAIKNYEISLKLNPKNDNAKIWIEKLKKK